MRDAMHVDEFIFNYCVSSMLSEDMPESSSESSAMNVFSIDENKIRDANGIIFAEAITCYKCTFCGKMFAAMEVVLTHYQSNHRCSVIPLLSTGAAKLRPVPVRPVGVRNKYSKAFPYGPIKSRTNVLSESTNESSLSNTSMTATIKTSSNKKYKCYYPGCTRSFSYKLGLEKHQKNHKKLKSYKCDWNDCKFKCSDLAGLRFHKNTHSGDNPFKCVWPGCSQSFPDELAKEDHLQKEHIKDAVLECEYPGCGQKFSTFFERERHNSSHIVKRARHKPPPVTNTKPPGKRGRPRKQVIIQSSDDDDNDDSASEEESSDDDFEENENQIKEVKEKVKMKEIKEIKVQKDDEDSKNEPLDLSKTALDLSKGQKTRPKLLDNESQAKRGRKRKKSLEKQLIQKTVFRCDYPGCRKTFNDSDLLHQHEKDNHKNLSSDNRSRYERRCKGNLYYKV